MCVCYALGLRRLFLGLGTRVGDTVEMGAVMNTIIHDRTWPLATGSFKPITGHTYTAAGALALLKVALMATKSTIPGTLHFLRPIELLQGKRASLVTESSALKIRDGVVSIHAHSVSGVNAHLVPYSNTKAV